MAVSVTSNMTTLHACESSTGWNTAHTAYSGFQREGSNCLGAQASQGAMNNWFTIASADYSNRTILAWFLTGNPGTLAQGGFRIVVGDGTNRIAFYVGGSDDMGFRFGPWSCCKLDCSNPPSGYAVLAGSRANLNFGATTQVGIGFYYVSKAVGNSPNVFYDVVRSVSNSEPALVIGGGTSGDPGTMAEVAALDDSTTYAWGIVGKLVSGSKAYAINFGVHFGNSASSSSYFQDSGLQLYIVGNAGGGMAHASGAVDVGLIGNATGTNSFKLSNSVLVNIGRDSDLDFDDTNFNVIEFNTVQFVSFGLTYLPAYNANKKVLACTFDECKEITASTCTFDTGCVVRNATGRGLKISSASHNVKNATFVGCVDAIRFDVGGVTYTLDNVKFSGNTYDIENTSSSAITVSCVNGSNPSTKRENPGTITISNDVVVKITARDIYTDSLLENVRILLEAASGGPLSEGTDIMAGLTNSSGVVQTTFNYTGDQPLKGQARRASSGYGTLYKPMKISGAITTVGYNATVLLIPDA